MTRIVRALILLVAVTSCGGDVGPSATDGSTTELPTTTMSPAPTITSTSTTPSAPSTTVLPTTVSPTTGAPGTTFTTTTSLVPADTKPPGLVVTAPVEGERVDSRAFRFRGTTEPDATLAAAGTYNVDVDEAGDWSAVLFLNLGGNVARFTATDAAGNVTDATVAVYYDPPLELRAEGLGPVDFFEPMESAMVVFVELLGVPDRDHIVSKETLPEDVGVGIGTGYPGREYARFVTWNAAGLEVMFSDVDASFSSDPVPANFNGWIATDPGRYGAELRTEAGIGPGAALSTLDAAYGASVTWYSEPDELTGDWHFNIATGTPYPNRPDETYRFFGRFDRDPATAGAVVARIQAGFGFDEC